LRFFVDILLIWDEVKHREADIYNFFCYNIYRIYSSFFFEAGGLTQLKNVLSCTALHIHEHKQ